MKKTTIISLGVLLFLVWIFLLSSVNADNYLQINLTGVGIFASTSICGGATSDIWDGNTGTSMCIQAAGVYGDGWLALNFSSSKNLTRFREHHHDIINNTLDIYATNNQSCSGMTQFNYGNYDNLGFRFYAPTIDTWYEINFSAPKNYTCWIFVNVNVNGNWWELHETETFIGNATSAPPPPQAQNNSCIRTGLENPFVIPCDCPLNISLSLSSNLTLNASTSGQMLISKQINFTAKNSYITIPKGCSIAMNKSGIINGP